MALSFRPSAGERRSACATPATARSARSNSTISRSIANIVHPARDDVFVLGRRDDAGVRVGEVRRPDKRTTLARIEGVLLLKEVGAAAVLQIVKICHPNQHARCGVEETALEVLHVEATTRPIVLDGGRCCHTIEPD